MSEYYSAFKGTCPVDRRIFETEWFCKLTIAESFLALYLLITANYETRPSKKMGQVIQRGQWGGSVGTEKRPGRLMNETGLSYSTLRDSLQKLIAVGFITKDVTVRGTIITIPQYDIWTKGTPKKDSQSNSKGNSQGNSSPDSNKEIKETEDNSTVFVDWDDEE